MHWRCLQLTLAALRKTELIVCSGLSVHSVIMSLFCDASQHVRFPYSDSRLGHVQMSQSFILRAFALCSTMPSPAYIRCPTCQDFWPVDYIARCLWCWEVDTTLPHAQRSLCIGTTGCARKHVKYCRNFPWYKYKGICYRDRGNQCDLPMPPDAGEEPPDPGDSYPRWYYYYGRYRRDRGTQC